MFKPSRRAAYDEVLPLPQLEDVADRVRRARVLLIVSPDSKIPPEEVQKFFDGLSQKNNLCVLTGDKTAMASVEKAARQLYAHRKPMGAYRRAIPSATTWSGSNRPTKRISTPRFSTFSIKSSSRSSAAAGRHSLPASPWT